MYGVQANLFTEYIPTPEHAEMMIYPRILALAGVAWSDPSVKNYDDFHVPALKEVEALKAEGYHPFDLKNEIGNRPGAEDVYKRQQLWLGLGNPLGNQWYLAACDTDFL